MTDIKEFRPINGIERKIILESLSNISANVSKIIGKIGDSLYISLNSSQKEYPQVFSVPKSIHETLREINKVSKISSAGLYFGFIKKGKFLISLEGTEFLHNSGTFSNAKKILINEKGEKSILYGNNILKQMIEKLPEELHKNDFLLVFNQKKELVAISTALCDSISYKDLKPKEIVAINLIDKGYYLRKKQ